MLNPAGLRRFPSPHSSLFFGFLVEFSDSNEEGRGGLELIYGGIPRSPEGGRQAPLPRPWAGPVGRPRGATGPPFFSRDLVANLKKKNLHLGPVALWGGDRGYF